VLGLGSILVATILAWTFTSWFWRFGLRSYPERLALGVIRTGF
jgi:hypothetical protein